MAVSCRNTECGLFHVDRVPFPIDGDFGMLGLFRRLHDIAAPQTGIPSLTFWPADLDFGSAFASFPAEGAAPGKRI